jgi:hypothetical protein
MVVVISSVSHLGRGGHGWLCRGRCEGCLPDPGGVR